MQRAHRSGSWTQHTVHEKRAVADEQQNDRYGDGEQSKEYGAEVQGNSGAGSGRLMLA